MASLRSLIRTIAPRVVVEAVRARRADREHEKLRPIFQHVDQALLDGIRVLSTREIMVEKMPKRGIVAEIGVAEGNFSRQILKRANPKELYLVDPWNQKAGPYSETSFHLLANELKAQIDGGQVKLCRGFSFDVLPGFKPDYFDWVYIDAAHDYEGVKSDLENSHRVVKSGGLISGHDYVRWVSTTDRYGVVEAVNEFVNRTRSDFVYLTNQFDKHDSFAIRINK